MYDNTLIRSAPMSKMVVSRGLETVAATGRNGATPLP